MDALPIVAQDVQRDFFKEDKENFKNMLEILAEAL